MCIRDRPYAEDAIYRQISDITISMKSADHLQMPKLVSSEYTVRLSEDEQKKYTDLKQELVLSLEMCIRDSLYISMLFMVVWFLLD